MKDLKIVGWTSFDSEYPTCAPQQDEMSMYAQLVSGEIREKGYCFSGDTHQNGAVGVPVFSDGTCFRCTMRCWGLVMAMAHSDPDGEEANYMDYYMGVSDPVLPEACEPSVAPADMKEWPAGFPIQQDIQLLRETLGMGMPMMTTDKVLQEMMRQIQEGNT